MSNNHLFKYLIFVGFVFTFSIIISGQSKLKAATCTWSGVDDGFWSTSTNWDCGGISAGDDLIFPVGASTTDTVNDLPDNTQFNSITINTDVYTFSGAPINLRGNFTFDDNDNSGTLDFGLNMTSVFDYLNFVVTGDQTTLFISGNLTGDVDVYKQGNGKLKLGGVNSFSHNLNVQNGVVILSSDSSINGAVVAVSDGASIYIDGSGGDLNLGGTSLQLNGNGYAPDGFGVIYNMAGNNVLDIPTDLFGTSKIAVASGSVLQLPGKITGGGGLEKALPGTLRLIGSVSNEYTGTTFVDDGDLILQTTGTSIPSADINVGDGTGNDDSARILVESSDQINSSANVIIAEDGFLAYENPGTSNNLGGLTLTDGHAKLTGTTVLSGTINLHGGHLEGFDTFSITSTAMTCEAGTSISLIDGDTVTFSGSDMAITAPFLDNGTQCRIQAPIHGGANIAVTGRVIEFNGNNDFTGTVTIHDGSVLQISNNNALGASSAGTIVEANGGLSLLNNITIASEPLTVSSNGISYIGSIASVQDSNSYNGPITISGTNVLFNSIGDAILTLGGSITGSISDTLSFAKFFPGSGYIQLAAANNFTAGSINLGDVTVRKTASVNVFPDTLNVNLNQYSTIDLNSFSETFGSLTGEPGSAIALGNATLSVGANNNDSTFNGTISGNGGVTKLGTGTTILTADNNYTGTTNIANGKLVINGQQPSSGISLNSTGILGGSGRVGVIVGGGTGGISPGNSPGILNVTGNVAFANTNNFNVEINGTTVGTNYDQLNVNGSINLNGATLNVALGYTPNSSDSFTIVQSTGVLIGTFNGLPNGSTFTVGGNTLRIDYGTNSVVISVSTGGGSGGTGGSNGNGSGGVLADTGITIPLAALAFLVSTTAVVVMTNKFVQKRKRLHKKNFR